MVMLAIDVVLLPEEAMMERVIALNKNLVEKFNSKIALNKQNCLPHISLAMGCIEQKQVGEERAKLEEISKEISPGELKAVGIRTVVNQVGEKVSSLEIEKKAELMQLHERVMVDFEQYMSSEPDEQMIWRKGKVSENTLNWIRGYRRNSSFENFFPHITVGYGRAESSDFPMNFHCEKLALCHLGNHCTCRQILSAVPLQ